MEYKSTAKLIIEKERKASRYDWHFLRKYNKKKYNKLTEEALKILFKSKLIIGEKMLQRIKR
nr:hypothetical protein [Mycoplasmopsis bovis]